MRSFLAQSRPSKKGKDENKGTGASRPPPTPRVAGFIGGSRRAQVTVKPPQKPVGRERHCPGALPAGHVRLK